MHSEGVATRSGPVMSPKNVNCYTAVRMATINGAKAVGREAVRLVVPHISIVSWAGPGLIGSW